MIHRVRHRRTFAAFGRGGRGRSGPVRVLHLPPGAPGVEPGPPQVAFAIGRRAGPAVQRNRLRRRLRAVFRELARQPGVLPPGAYLVSADPSLTETDPETMKMHVSTAVQQATHRDRRR